jgi:hypothetical protein
MEKLTLTTHFGFHTCSTMALNTNSHVFVCTAFAPQSSMPIGWALEKLTNAAQALTAK